MLMSKIASSNENCGSLQIASCDVPLPISISFDEVSIPKDEYLIKHSHTLLIRGFSDNVVSTVNFLKRHL